MAGSLNFIEKKYEIPLLIMTVLSVAMAFWALSEKTQFAINVYLLTGVALTTMFILLINEKIKMGDIGFIMFGAMFHPMFFVLYLGLSDLGQRFIQFKIFDFTKKKRRNKQKKNSKAVKRKSDEK